MAKRIQMRKQRFMAIQKIAEQKKKQAEDANHPPPPPPTSDHGHGHGHGHSHGHQHTPKQQIGSRSGTMSNVPPHNIAGSRGCSIVGPLFQEVRFKVHDPKAHSKGGTLENTINGGRGGGGPPGGGGGPPGGGGGGPDEESGAPQHLIHPGKVGGAFAGLRCGGFELD